MRIRVGLRAGVGAGVGARREAACGGHLDSEVGHTPYPLDDVTELPVLGRGPRAIECDLAHQAPRLHHLLRTHATHLGVQRRVRVRVRVRVQVRVRVRLRVRVQGRVRVRVKVGVRVSHGRSRRAPWGR